MRRQEPNWPQGMWRLRNSWWTCMNLFNFQVILAISTNANARLAKVFRSQTEKNGVFVWFQGWFSEEISWRKVSRISWKKRELFSNSSVSYTVSVSSSSPPLNSPILVCDSKSLFSLSFRLFPVILLLFASLFVRVAWWSVSQRSYFHFPLLSTNTCR